MTPNKPLLLAAVILLLFVAPLRRFHEGQRNASALPSFLNAKTWGGTARKSSAPYTETARLKNWER
jgi:hypothetical protein